MLNGSTMQQIWPNILYLEFGKNTSFFAIQKFLLTSLDHNKTGQKRLCRHLSLLSSVGKQT